MKTEALVMRATGGPEVLAREVIDLDEPSPRHVRVRVRAVAMNHLDLWVRRGLPHIRYEFPYRLGSDIAGEIDALGEGVKDWSVGDRVLVNPGLSCGVCETCLLGRDNLCKHYRIFGEGAQGGYARHINVPDANLLPFPAPLSFTDAAAVPLVFLTAWQMTVEKAKVGQGQTVLVQAAGGGVGSAAVQIAKRLGAYVIAVVGTDAKIERVRALGADHVVSTQSADFVAECKRLTNRAGVDAVIESVGGDVFVRSVVATKWGGRVVTCGATAGFTPTLDLRQIFFRQVQVLGSTMGPKGDLFAVLRLVTAGKLKPVVDRVLPLWDAAVGHVALERREAVGKIVLAVD
jgi:NADPH:quinone reductase-like Zn-dependent oxidoreductase